MSGDDQNSLNPERPAKKCRKAKTYVPSLRSGPYALILALSSLPEGEETGMTKAQLIELAQEHCDSSFTAPTDNSKFYTAWNSMKSLIDKDLVYEKGRPLRRYLLSDEGWEVAKRIQNVQGGRQGSRDVGPLDPLVNFPGSDKSGRSVNNPGNLELLGKATSWLGTNRDTRISNGSSLGRGSGAPAVDQFGFIVASQDQRLSVAGESSASDGERVETIPCPGPQSGPSAGPYKPTPDTERRATQPYATVVPACRDSKSPPGGIRETEQAVAFPNIKPIQLQPGTFTVQLVLDSREVRAKNDRDYIQDELVKQGVKALVRPLELGDFFWVAKCKEPGLLGRSGEEGDEVALDWIIERKRLDDLVESIKDGRFQEQKFRLRKMGVKNVVYVVEEFTMSSERMSQFHEAIESAIGSMQVVDGYFVKKTMKLDDTIRYLARMTSMLKSLYEVRHHLRGKMLSHSLIICIGPVETSLHYTFKPASSRDVSFASGRPAYQGPANFAQYYLRLILRSSIQDRLPDPPGYLSEDAHVHPGRHG